MELRFKQNVQAMETVNRLEPGLSNRLFKGWKSIMQCDPVRSVALTPLKKDPEGHCSDGLSNGKVWSCRLVSVQAPRAGEQFTGFS